ncbi:MAG TPA: type II secretion system protein GspC [Microbacterium sp.]|nr:type II secretion system protein GspC [Microbacterium sp.]
MAVLVVAIAHRLAELTWLAIPHTPFDRPTPVIVQPASDANGSAAAANFSALEDSDLFGKAPEMTAEAEPVPVEAEVDAPDTTLSIRLTGVAADEEGKLSIAIVASGRSDERKYRIGQEIENTNGATLHAVYADRVILNRGGRLEALRLPKEPSGAAPRAASRIAPAAPAASAPAAPVENATFRDLANENAPRLTDIMRLAPQYEGGQMLGFRVNPGRNRQAFEALGLQPNDVVTQINGIVLDDPNRALQVFEALGESVQAEVTVVRDGVPNVLVVDTSQLQSIVEDRQ